MLRIGLRVAHDLAGIVDTFGRALDGGGDEVERRGGFFEARGLLFRAAGQFIDRVGDLDGVAAHRLGLAHDGAHRVAERRNRAAEVVLQFLVFAGEDHVDAVGEIGACEPFEGHRKGADDVALRGGRSAAQRLRLASDVAHHVALIHRRARDLLLVGGHRTKRRQADGQLAQLIDGPGRCLNHAADGFGFVHCHEDDTDNVALDDDRFVDRDVGLAEDLGFAAIGPTVLQGRLVCRSRRQTRPDQTFSAFILDVRADADIADEDRRRAAVGGLHLVDNFVAAVDQQVAEVERVAGAPRIAPAVEQGPHQFDVGIQLALRRRDRVQSLGFVGEGLEVDGEAGQRLGDPAGRREGDETAHRDRAD